MDLSMCDYVPMALLPFVFELWFVDLANAMCAIYMFPIHLWDVSNALLVSIFSTILVSNVEIWLPSHVHFRSRDIGHVTNTFLSFLFTSYLQI